jgi:redox-sensitive bicupin YhaK (pirin superfamily)
MPRSRGINPVYGSLPDSSERREARRNQFEHIVGDRLSNESVAPIRIDADCNFYLSEVDAGKQVELVIGEDRQAYILQIEGRSILSNSFELEEGDAATAVGSHKLYFDALENSLILVIELKRA